jgi:spermidine/putrescine transport system permease protein
MRLSPLAIFLLSLVAVFVAILLYGPLAVTIFFSFFRLERNEVQWESFSFDAYRALFHNGAVLDSLMNTLTVGVSAVVLALIFGTLIAFHYRGSRSRMRHLLQLIVFLPFLMPPIITGLSLLIFFRELDVPRSLATVIVGHTVFVLAIVYQIVLTRLEALRPSLIDASLDLGASRWQTFRFVLVPNLISAFISAAVLAFALSFDETLITLLVTGTRNTLPMWLWSSMRLGFKPDINALVALILFFSTAFAFVAVRLFRPAPGA